jgi:hypothetical protein
MILIMIVIGSGENDYLLCLQVLSPTELPTHHVEPSPRTILTTMS